MRKREKVLAATVAAVCAFSLCACDDASGANPMPPPTALLAPYVVSLGGFLYWDKVDGADVYVVYCDGEEQSVVTENSYDVGDARHEYTVVAENSSFAGVKSKPSNTVTAGGEPSGEVLNVKLHGGYSVPADVDTIVVESGEYYGDIDVGGRSRDITIVMTDVRLHGSIRTFDKSYSRLKYDYNVILVIGGECSVTGDKGEDGYGYNAWGWDNSEHNGDPGERGDTAVVVPSLIVRGDGTLTLTGGDGGKGGKGADATEGSKKHSGAGGSGGDGGAAIETSYFVLDMSDGGTVSITDGKGGAKGARGNNADVGTGFNEWFFGAPDGVDGIDGESKLGREFILGGSLNR